jgi:hypothetical protein
VGSGGTSVVRASQGMMGACPCVTGEEEARQSAGGRDDGIVDGIARGGRRRFVVLVVLSDASKG